MKTLKYIRLAMAALVIGMAATSCMDDDWDNPTGDIPPYGNNNLEETNVLTIAELKDRYADAFKAQNDTTHMTDDVQIKARVTGNDISGNIYSYISVDDGTGGLIIAIAQGGLWAYLPVGQEILVSLKDLYIGNNNYTPYLGTPYTSFGDDGNPRYTFPSRMNRTLWQEHFKLLEKHDASTVVPVEIDADKLTDNSYLMESIAKLVTVKGVTLTDADGEATFAPEEELLGGAVNRKINGNKNFVLRTSNYADFAATVMPQGKVDITGVLTRFGSTWQLIMRTSEDIKQAE